MSSLVEIYPREGTETNQMLIFSPLAIVEIYPREGTETHSRKDSFHSQMVEIYPREGTETTCKQLFNEFLLLKFIPVRGRKRGQKLIILFLQVEIYPREGTET